MHFINPHAMGGDCLNYGCVPSKALIRSAKVAHQIRHGDQYGLNAATPDFSFRKVMARVREVIRTVAPHDSVERYTRLGVDVIQGHARIITPWTVQITLNDGTTQTLKWCRAITVAAWFVRHCWRAAGFSIWAAVLDEMCMRWHNWLGKAVWSSAST